MQKLKDLFAGSKKAVVTATVVGSAAIMTSPAFAVPVAVDVADVLAALALAVITVTAVCTAALSIVVVVKVFKFVRSAF